VDNNENVQKSGQVSILLDACDKLRADLAAATLRADAAQADLAQRTHLWESSLSDLARVEHERDAAQEELRKAREQVPVAFCKPDALDNFKRAGFRVDDMQNCRLTKSEIALFAAAPVPAQPQPSWNVCKHCLNTRKEAQPQPSCPHCHDTGKTNDLLSNGAQPNCQWCAKILQPSPEGVAMDAARYQWLKSSKTIHDGAPFIARNFGASFSMWTNDDADRVIDEAIAAAKVKP